MVVRGRRSPRYLINVSAIPSTTILQGQKGINVLALNALFVPLLLENASC